MLNFKPIISAPSEADNTTYFVHLRESNVCVGVVAKNICGWQFFNTRGIVVSNTYGNREDLFAKLNS